MAHEEAKSEPGPDDNPLLSLLRISRHLAGQVEIRSALKAVKEEIETLLPIDHLDVCLIDDEARWNTSYEVGIRTRWSQSRTLVTVSPIRDILHSRTDYFLTDNAMEDPRYTFAGAISEPIFKHQLRSRINVSMKVLGRTIGALNCSSRKPGLYNEATVQRVRHVADVLAPYFHALRVGEKAKQAAIIRAEAQAREEGLRQGALELTRALEQERQRIGMDLHDQTLADLTRLARELERGKDPLDREDLIDHLTFCIRDLRRIIDTAVPTLLELFGFAHALRIHLERAVEEDAGTAIEVDDRTDGQIDSIDPTTRIALYRIAQEAINNAARHADATEIKVTITNDKGRMKLSVADNGKGIVRRDLGRAMEKATGGLAHMQTRARLIAADFRIRGSRGLKIEVTLPDGLADARSGTLDGVAFSAEEAPA